MARYRGSISKISRNLGVVLDGYPKTERIKRRYGSGQHGQARKKYSDYAIQLREKQKVRVTYGLLEKQFRRYYEFAQQRKGDTGTILLQRLESRLDNVLYRSGLVESRPQSRQMIVHGHILVNGRKVDVPSFICRQGDTVTIREKSQKLFKGLQEGRAPVVPHWLTVDNNALSVIYNATPAREDIDPTFQENLIVEYYSR